MKRRQTKVLHFDVAAGTIVALGQESIRDSITALIELTKNAYDADASVVEITLSTAQDMIIVRDNGHGMTRQDIIDKWLTIGWSHKRTRALSPRGRRITGEKGVGRISADRLGRNFELRSQSSQDSSTGIQLDWDDFRANKRLSEVPVFVIDNAAFKVPKWHNATKDYHKAKPQARYQMASQSATGSELRISGLRTPWTMESYKALQNSLGSLVSPSVDINDFHIWLQTDIEGASSGLVTNEIADAAHSTLHATCTADGDIVLKLRRTEGSERVIETTWEEFIDAPHPRARRIGPLVIEYYFYPRKSVATESASVSLTEIKDYLNINQGVRVYRDNIRVMPYGNLEKPGGDWLDLAGRRTQNPAGVGRASFRIAQNQLIGLVSIERDRNPEIIDSTAREGLIENDGFRVLRLFALSALKALEVFVHETYVEETKKISPEKEVRAPREKAQDLVKQLRGLEEDLTQLDEQEQPTSRKAQREVHERISSAKEKIASTKDSLRELTGELEELVRQATIFRGLATIGVAATTFGHETMGHIDRISLPMLNAAKKLRTQLGKEDRTAARLDAARETDLERVRQWATFALTRVARDKRTRKMLDVSDFLKSTIADVRPLP